MKSDRILVMTMLVLAVGCDDGDERRVPWNGAPAGGTSSHADDAPADDGDGTTAAATSADAEPPAADATDGAPGGDDGHGTSTGAPAGSTGDGGIDTWESWAWPEFFEPYCNQCHPGQSTLSFSDYDTVVANEEHIRCGVAPDIAPGCDGHIEPGHLPIGGGPFPDDATRWRLVDWVLAGMPRQ